MAPVANGHPAETRQPQSSEARAAPAAPADAALPNDPHAAFQVRLSDGRPADFPPPAFWPGPPPGHVPRLAAELKLLERGHYPLAPTPPADPRAAPDAPTPATPGPVAAPAAPAAGSLALYDPAAPALLTFAARGRPPAPDLLGDLQRFFGACLFDRTDTLHRPVRAAVESAPPPPSRAAAAEELPALLDARARAVLARAAAAGRDVLLLCAGDLESTAMVTAFLRAAADAGHSERVVLARPARWPGPATWFMTHVVERHPRVLRFAKPAELFGTARRYRRDGVLVHASHGGLLIGSEFYTLAASDPAFRLSREELAAPWREVVPAYFARLGATDKLLAGGAGEGEGAAPGAAGGWLEALERQVEKAPVAVDSAFKFLWWVGFSCLWQFASLWLHLEAPPAASIGRDDVVGFFATEEFQQWGYRNVSADFTTYKDHFQDYLTAYYYEDHFRKMCAVPSCFFMLTAYSPSRVLGPLGLDDQLQSVGPWPTVSLQAIAADPSLTAYLSPVWEREAQSISGTDAAPEEGAAGRKLVESYVFAAVRRLKAHSVVKSVSEEDLRQEISGVTLPKHTLRPMAENRHRRSSLDTGDVRRMNSRGSALKRTTAVIEAVAERVLPESPRSSDAGPVHVKPLKNMI